MDKSEFSPSLDYVARINKAIDHVLEHLDGSLRLVDVARAAHFSEYHFHRIFKLLMGESLNPFVKRQRLERALYLMSHAPGKSLTEVSLQCGFASSSDFSRSFKKHFGVKPSAFELQKYRDTRREEFSKAMANQGGAPQLLRLPPGENPDGFEVKLRKLPSRTVAYIRVLNPYEGSGPVDACHRLMEWADGLGHGQGQWLGYMWEDPEIVALSDCRYDVAVEVDDFKPEGEVGRIQFPPMLVAEVSLSGDIHLVQRALDWVFGTWLPNSGFTPDDQPCFEAWQGRPFAHGMEHFEIRIQLPVTDRP